MNTFTYSLIRFVPDPVRQEFVNAGFVVGNDDEGWYFESFDIARRSRCIDPERHVNHFLRAIEMIEQAWYDDEGSSSDWLTAQHRDQRNLANFTQPLPMLAESVEEAYERLSHSFGVPDAVPQPRQSTGKIKSDVRRLFTARGIIRNEQFFEGCDVRTAKYSDKTDFAVATGVVVQLIRAWTFRKQDLDELLNEIKSWTWSMHAIRSDGGNAQVTEELALPIPRGVEIDAILVPPSPTSNDQRLRAYEEATAALHEVNANIETPETADHVVERAETLIAA